MKKWLCMCALGVALVLSGCGKSNENVLTVFNYGEYMDPEVIQMFEEETGIQVKYEEAITPEEMYTKYISGAIKYDLLCTSDYMVDRLIREGEAQQVDFSSMEYADNIGQRYWDFAKAYDPDNSYSLPYFWGTVGILYDSTKVKGPVDSWEVLFNGEYAGDFIMQNSMRDAYMVALKYLGYSLNTTDEAQIREAHALLMEQKPDVQAYLVDEARDEVVVGNATMAVIYSGEAYLGHEYNEDLRYVVPKEGSNVWLDSWVVTKNCANPENAAKFLDFLCREDVAAMNFEYIYYSTPNEAVIENMTETLRNDETIIPADSSTDNCEVYVQLDEASVQLYNDLFKDLKAN